MNKSIRIEAKALAKTFEEYNSDSEYDFISNDTSWMPELLPAYDEDVVDNLIELSISPEKNAKNTKNNDIKQSPTSIDNVKENSQMGIEVPLTDYIPSVTETTITTLLLDLKKSIGAKNNLKAIKLIDELEHTWEKNLYVKYSNTELLDMCFKISNKLKIPEMSDDKSLMDVAEESRKTDSNESQKENSKISFQEKIYNNKKSPSTNQKLEDMSQDITVSSDNSSAKISSYKDSSEDQLNITDSPKVLNADSAKERDHLNDLLVTFLKELLSGKAKDTTMLQLLENIRKDVASNTYKIENESQMSNKNHNIQQVTLTQNQSPECDTQIHSISTKAVKFEQSFDFKSKSHEKVRRRSASVSNSPIRNSLSTQIYKYKDISESKNLKKHFSSNPEFINTIASKRIAIPEICNKRNETIESNSKEKSLALTDVRSKFKKKPDVVNKKGPMKAVHPVDNMQRKMSLGKQMISSFQTTPPKSSKKIISSTPNSINNNYSNSPKEVVKPMASSTPDGQHNKTSSARLMSTNSSKKRNFSCDISPVITCTNISSDHERKGTPKRVNKLPTPKRYTRSRTNSFSMPKYSPPRKHNSSLDMNYHQSVPKSPCLTNYQRCSPVYSKKNTEKRLQSPLKDSNKITTKIKPSKLISKFKRHSISDFAEKENNYI